MDSCSHVSSQQRLWLPLATGLLKMHPHCVKCGVVKNVSSDRGKNVGYFVNSLNELRKFLEKKGYKISQSQIRLIIKEFENEGLDDVYSVSFSTQKREFVKIVRKYVRVSDETIESFV